MPTTIPANDLALARRLAGLITQGVDTLNALGTSSQTEHEREREAILTITSAATQLNALVRPPAHVLLDIATSFTLCAALRLVVEANVPEVIRTLSLSKSESLASNLGKLHDENEHELEETDQEKPAGVPVSAIAILCGVQASKLERILRLLATHHIFVEVPPAPAPSSVGGGAREPHFANNRLSEAIDSGVRLEDILDVNSVYLSLGVEGDIGDDVKIKDDSGCFLVSSTDLDPRPLPASESTTKKRKREVVSPGPGPGPDSASDSSEMKDGKETKIVSEPREGGKSDKGFGRKEFTGLGLGRDEFEVFEGLKKAVKELKERRDLEERKDLNQLKATEESKVRDRDRRWAAKYGSSAPGAGLAALVGLLTDESMFHATALTEVLLPSSSPVFSHSERDPESVHNTAFFRARFGTLDPDKREEKAKEMTMFDWLALPGNAHRLHRFGCAMRGMGALTNSNESEDGDGILKGFDFSALPPGSTIVDVGGGVGAASLPILRAYSHLNLNLIVQDTEVVIANAPAFGEINLPSALHSGRVTFQVQDFFEAQPSPFPSSSAVPDVFLLRMIMHNWGDAPCLKILSNLRRAAREETKLILVDNVLMRACREPEPEWRGEDNDRGEGDTKVQKRGDLEVQMQQMRARETPEPLLANWGAANGLAYRLDLIMLANHNASERTLAQFDALLSAAGWTIKEVHRGSTASESWMPQIVAVPVDFPVPGLGPDLDPARGLDV